MYKSDEPEDMLRRVFVFLKIYDGPLTLNILGTLTNSEESTGQLSKFFSINLLLFSYPSV